MAETIEFQTPSKKHIVETALGLVGNKSQRYENGYPELGQSPGGFDCSGFVRYVLLQSGFHIPDFVGMDNVRRTIRHANEFWDHYGASIQTQPEAGDLIFFSRQGLFPTHMGIVCGEESFIHSPGTENSKVIIGKIAVQNIAPRHGTDRVLFATNPIGFKAPMLPQISPTYRDHQKLAE